MTSYSEMWKERDKQRKVKNEGKGLSEGLRKGVYRRGGGAEPEKMDGGGWAPH